MTTPLRVGLVGAGDNTRVRHIPGLRAQPGVELVAVCNRRPASTEAVAREIGIRRTFRHWQDLVADPDIDAVVIGTWPHLHAPVTVAALAAGKHVLCEARMALNAQEARGMLAAAQARPDRVAQLVPSPMGLTAHATVVRLLAGGAIGTLREVEVVARNGGLADPSAPLAWRQDATLSGVNMLFLGIVHETVARWVPPVTRVLAQATAFVPERVDPESGTRRPVGTPDSVQVLATLAGGARAVYQCSGATPAGGGTHIRLYGTAGTLHYDLAADRLTLAPPGGEFAPVEVPAHERGGWAVEADWVASIREGRPVQFTDFERGVAYMEFTEAVAKSAEAGVAVDVPAV
jgi:predicted dehydrogenase